MVLLDLKTFDTERHRASPAWTTRPRTRSRDGCAASPDLEFVMCWCPKPDDDPEDVARPPRSPVSSGNVERVDVLPFHQMGQPRWKKLGLDYTLENTRRRRTNSSSRRVRSSGARG